MRRASICRPCCCTSLDACHSAFAAFCARACRAAFPAFPAFFTVSRASRLAFLAFLTGYCDCRSAFPAFPAARPGRCTSASAIAPSLVAYPGAVATPR